MTASFKTGGSCSEPKRYNIGVNSTTKEIDGSIAPTTDSTADEEEADNCDARFNNPLSWGICPVIAMATDMSAFAFKNFIQPFLEENPISTHTDSTKTKENGIYIAWKSFRLIANILLVGTMLVVVYSTIKGSSR